MPKDKSKEKEAKAKESKDKGKSKSKDKKSSKNSKSRDKRGNKYANVDKGDCPNKATAFAKLFFNVKTCHKWLAEYYTRYTIKRKPKKDDDSKKTDKDSKKNENVKITNAHYILTAVDQVMCLYFVNLAGKRSKKADAGLHTITEESLMDCVKLDKDLKFAFGKYMEGYSQSDNYGKQMTLEKKIVDEFIEKYAFDGGNSNIHIENGAYNFLSYILLKTRIQLAEAAFHMVVFSGRSSVNDKALLAAIKIMFTGELLKSLIKKTEDVSNRVRNIENEKGDDDSKNGSGDSKHKEKSKKVSKKNDSEAEESEGSDGEESGNESGNESDGSEKGSGSESEDSD